MNGYFKEGNLKVILDMGKLVKWEERKDEMRRNMAKKEWAKKPNGKVGLPTKNTKGSKDNFEVVRKHFKKS